jgi:transcriptional regulator of arginine metabolism
MKHSRHDKILELIAEHDIATQEELLSKLKINGFDVTQATVSRDIKQLRLIKSLSKNGRYAYTFSGKVEANDLADKFDVLLAESAIKIDYVMNQIVIKCYSGLANAVCAALDPMHYDGVVGTISGDDTILVIMRSEKQAETLFNLLEKKLS